MLRALLEILRLPYFQILQLLGIIILIYTLDHPRRFLKNLIKISKAVVDAEPMRLLDTIYNEIDEEGHR